MFYADLVEVNKNMCYDVILISPLSLSLYLSLADQTQKSFGTDCLQQCRLGCVARQRPIGLSSGVR